MCAAANAATAVDAVAYHLLGVYVDIVSIHAVRVAGHFYPFVQTFYYRRPIDIFNPKASLLAINPLCRAAGSNCAFELVDVRLGRPERLSTCQGSCSTSSYQKELDPQAGEGVTMDQL